MSDKEKVTAEEEVVNDTEQTETEKVELSEEDMLKAEVEGLKKVVAEFKDKWMRSVAEFDNYKKRNARLYVDAFTEGQAETVLKILPIGDNLDIAISMVSDEKTVEGLKLLRKKFDETLKGMEVSEINPVGEIFSPEIAEAVMQVEGADGEEPDTVKQVFQKGYKLKEKIIRYAKVSVVK